MALINERDRKTLAERFDRELKNPVTLVYFTQGQTETGIPAEPCMACRDTQQILEQMAGLSDKISLAVHDFVGEADLAREYGTERIPATILESNGHRLRYYGMPSGYEFSLLVESILDISRGTSDLSPRSKEQLGKVERPVHLQVFVTPT